MTVPPERRLLLGSLLAATLLLVAAPTLMDLGGAGEPSPDHGGVASPAASREASPGSSLTQPTPTGESGHGTQPAPLPAPQVEAPRELAAETRRQAPAGPAAERLPIRVRDPFGELVPHARVLAGTLAHVPPPGREELPRWMHARLWPFALSRSEASPRRMGLRAEALGPGWGQAFATVEPRGNTDPVITLVLGADAPRWGRVIDADGAPLAGVVLALVGAQGKSESSSGALGRFPTVVPPGGLERVVVMGVVPASEGVMQRAPGVELLTNSGSGSPVLREPLTVVSDDPLVLRARRSPRVRLLVTEADGRTPPPAGPEHKVEVLAVLRDAGAEADSALAEPRTGTGTDSGTDSGTGANANANADADADANANALPARRVALEPDGSAVVAFGHVGLVDLWVRQGERIGGPVRVELLPDETVGPVRVRLDGTSRVAGRVVDPQGLPVGGAWVGRAVSEARLSRELGSQTTDWREPLPAPSDRDPAGEGPAQGQGGVDLVQSAPDGSFSLPFAAGVVGARHPAFRPTLVEVGAPTLDLQLVLDPGHVVQVSLGVLPEQVEPAALWLQIEGPAEGTEAPPAATPGTAMLFDAWGDSTERQLKAVVPGVPTRFSALVSGTWSVSLHHDGGVLAQQELILSGPPRVWPVRLDPGDQAVTLLQLTGARALVEAIALRPLAGPVFPDMGDVGGEGEHAVGDDLGEGRWRVQAPWTGPSEVVVRYGRARPHTWGPPRAWQAIGQLELPPGFSEFELPMPDTRLEVEVLVDASHPQVLVDVLEPAGEPVASSLDLTGGAPMARFEGLPADIPLVLELRDVHKADSFYLGRTEVMLTAGRTTRALLEQAGASRQRLELMAVDHLGAPLAGIHGQVVLGGLTYGPFGPTDADGKLVADVPAGLAGSASMWEPEEPQRRGERPVKARRGGVVKVRLLREAAWWVVPRLDQRPVPGGQVTLTPLNVPAGGGVVTRTLSERGECGPWPLSPGLWRVTLITPEGVSYSREVTIGPQRPAPTLVDFP